MRFLSAPSFIINDAEDFFNTEIDPTKSFNSWCAFTWEYYQAFINNLVDNDNAMIVSYEFPKGIVCSNAHFNKDDDSVDPTDQFALANK